MNWITSFIDRHPGWSLLWALFGFGVSIILAMFLLVTARDVADWLWPRLNKNKDKDE